MNQEELDKIKGKAITEVIYSKWTELQWYNFIKFVDFHIDVVKKKNRGSPKDHYFVNEEKAKVLNEYKKDPNHPFTEYIYRVNGDPTLPTAYLSKLHLLVHKPLAYLREHPKLINEEMKQIMEARPNMLAKYLKLYFLQKPAKPIEVSPVVSGDEIQQKQMNTFIKMINLHEELVDSIHKEGVDNLSSAQKFTALPKLVDAISKMGQKKQSSNLTINIGGSAREKEEAMLAFIKSEDKDN